MNLRELLLLSVTIGQTFVGTASAEAAAPQSLTVVKDFCVECHNSDHAESGIDLQSLAAADTFSAKFRDWLKVVAQLEAGTMPPKDADQPTKSQRQALIANIRASIRKAAEQHAGEPGHVVIRRLTSAEYAYTIRDLTGLDLDLERGFVGDAVGGAGFTNTGIAQFVQDSTLERYLETARQIADHAVIGSGSLTFHQDPGQTGFELSAISRINNIYRTHGFRTAAGEGGEAFGLQQYSRAFYTAWLFKHRQALGLDDATMESLALSEGVAVRFAEYIHSVLSDASHAFPLSDIVERWQRLPAPNSPEPRILKATRESCEGITEVMYAWQDRFGQNPDAKEEAPVLDHRWFDASRTKLFEMNINWPKGTRTAHLVLSVESANRDGTPAAVVVWKNPQMQFRIDDEVLEDPRPLRQFLDPAVVRRMKFGTHPQSGNVGANDFVTVGTQPPAFELPIIPGARSARLLVTAELDVEHGEDCIVRCTIAQLEETDQGKSVSGLLADPASHTFAPWKAGVLDFARLMPQVSQREPAPSDRDPIPPPFDASYNNAERNYYHTHIKYHRDDAFLVDNVLDDNSRRQLDQAWIDLLGSFEFHNRWLNFVCDRFGVDREGRNVRNIDPGWVASLPLEPRRYISRIHHEYVAHQAAFKQAEAGQLDDVIDLAVLAWRRPLLPSDEDHLRSYYSTLRSESGLNHQSALRALMTRILVAPTFLYRAERAQSGGGVAALNQWELASRLSYFLWSSPPDQELQRAAAAGELHQEAELEQQARRMLRSPKASRFAAEFFGQWFGFYRFDQHRGIDPQRFPEFSESLRASMHAEAVEFFSHIVRQDRPVNEILFADYTFVNEELSAHYGLDIDGKPARTPVPEADALATPQVGSSAMRRLDGASAFHRGGLLRLSSVLAVTSAPLRTSPVKRGDWVLRRVLGTPVPPPPADAGSIAADETVADGRSIRERLKAHRREASCANCHSRIDALGFALEQFDPLGRWRDAYRDGNPIENSGELGNGVRISGDAGLLKYLATQQPLFHQTLCRKLLAYALGRREVIGDLSLLDEMAADLARDGRLSQLVERIVTSRQFRYLGKAE